MCKKFDTEFYKDISQEVWIKVYLKWDIYKKNGANDESMIRTITKSKCIDFIRQIKYHEPIESANSLIEEVIVDRSVDIVNLKFSEVLKSIISRISDERMKSIATNIYLKDLTLDEVSEELSFLGLEVPRKILYRCVWDTKQYLINSIKTYKKETIDVNFELGD